MNWTDPSLILSNSIPSATAGRDIVLEDEGRPFKISQQRLWLESSEGKRQSHTRPAAVGATTQSHLRSVP